jgi:hypothetical protein
MVPMIEEPRTLGEKGILQGGKQKSLNDGSDNE